jgi:Cd2+/Zn2+-exporting ATPase
MVITLMIFGSPLELALITPLTLLAGTVAAFRQGILIKSGRSLEVLAYIDTMIFDKTGTLTAGEPHIVAAVSYDAALSSDDIVRLAAIAEKYSDHVVAKALTRKTTEENISVPSPDQYSSIIGQGVIMEYQGKRYFFGSKRFMEAAEYAQSVIPLGKSCEYESLHSIFYLASEGKVIGKICMADEIRHDAQETIHALRDAGINTIVLLSGDRQEIAHTIAGKLSITQSYGEMFPDQKLLFIQKLQQTGHRTAMVGDGINDAAALQQAQVGIAMGAMGMEPAIHAADIVLMTNELYKIVFVRKLAQKVFRVIKQNLFVGFLLLHTVGLVLTQCKSSYKF